MMHSDFTKVASALLAVLATGAFAQHEPCAQISQLYANANVPSGEAFNFPGQLGQDCLLSMPFDSEKAVSFVDEYTKYVNFQSTLELLRNPPTTYLSSPVDILGGLAGIRSRAASNYYKSQYQFDLDIFNLVGAANDGHFAILPCSLATIWFFIEPNLVSISTDGTSAPQLYTDIDAISLANGVQGVSPISYINGVAPAALIEKLSGGQGFQDPDARYNQMLLNLPVDGQGNQLEGSFPLAYQWPGSNTVTFTYANGSVEQVPVLAQIPAGQPPFNAADGDSLFQAVCGSANSSSSSNKLKARQNGGSSTPPGPPAGYPTPVMREAYNTIVGYYPQGHGLDDVAVLSVPTFETSGATVADSTFVDFAVIAEWFVQNATTDGKKKIIIDVSNNPGGVIDSGWALLSVFLPNETIYSGTRFRSHDAMNLLGQVYNTGDQSQNQIVNESGLYIPALVKPNQVSTFSSWAQLFGPYDIDGVPSSALVAEIDFADEANPLYDPINIDGDGGYLNARTPPFAPEDILILTDGRCSSTCTIFSDHMVAKGVKTVAMGGRPHPGPMQAIGGVKGSQVLELDGEGSLSQGVDEGRSLVQQAAQSGSPILSSAQQSLFDKVMPIPLEEFPLPLSIGSVNFRNTFTQDDDSVPTQFVYEPANCHLFYTAATFVDPQATWALAANAIWGNGGCVGGVQQVNATDPPPSGSSGSGSAGKTEGAVTQPGQRTVLGLLLALGKGFEK